MMIQNQPRKTILIGLIGIGDPEREPFLDVLPDTTIINQNTDDIMLMPLMTRITKGVVEDKNVWLLDVLPSTATDGEIHDAIKSTLDEDLPQRHANQLDGIICLHDITETATLKATAERNIATLKTLVGSTSGANILLVTTLWDNLASTVQGFRAEAALKALYSACFPDVAVRRVEDSRDDDMESIYESMIHVLLSRIESMPDNDDDSGPSTPDEEADLKRIIRDKEQQLAKLRAKLGILQKELNERLLQLREHVEQENCLRDTLQRTKQELESQLEEQDATFLVKLNRLQKQFDAERQDLNAKLSQAETDREDFKDLQQQLKGRHLNPRLNVLNESGGFPLYSAAAGGHYEKTKWLLQQGADASMRTRFDWTALHWAVGNGHAKVVKLLLIYGADVNAVSDTRKTPLSMAQSDEIRRMLLQMGAK